MRLRLLVAVLVSLFLLNCWLRLARGSEESYSWCIDLSPTELLQAVDEWRCVYGGAEAFSQGDAPFLAEVWQHAGSLWYRVAPLGSRLDPRVYQCYPQAYLTYSYSDFLWLSATVHLKECGFAVCKGRLNMDFLTTR
jgi:hypothetical protein